MSLEQRRQPNADAIVEIAKAHAMTGIRRPCRTCKQSLLMRRISKSKWTVTNLDGSAHHCHLEAREELLIEKPIGPPVRRSAVRITCGGCQDPIDVCQKARGGIAHFDAGTHRPHRCPARNVSRTHDADVIQRKDGYLPTTKVSQPKHRPAAWKELDSD